MENQHRKIKTYRELSQQEIDLMNEGKELEAQVNAFMRKLAANTSLDQRCVAIGKTEIQQGFMWLIRSVTKPEEL